MSGLLKFITCGSVDDGKSTLIGHILYDSKLLYADQERALELDSKVGSRGGAIDYSLLLDGLMAEREQGITIDVAYRYFTTDKRSFIVADTPGHEEYTRNMAVGASFADLAIILVDAKQGVLVQTRRHARICALMGIRYFIFAVNKMDLIQYDQTRFNEIAKQINELSEELKLENVKIIPVSATEGDNVTTKSENITWYDGEAILPYLENVEINNKDVELGFYLPVQRVCRPNHTFRGFQGQVESGSVSVGDTITTLPSNEKAKVKSILIGDKEADSASAVQPVTIQLDKEVDVSRGCVLIKDNAITVSNSVTATLLWMDDEELTIGKDYLVKIGTKQIPGVIANIKYKIDVNSGQAVQTEKLEKNELAVCDIMFQEKIVVDEFNKHRTLGELILIDRISNMTSACGVVNKTQITQDENEKSTFAGDGVKARGDIFEEYYYNMESQNILKARPVTQTYHIVDVISTKGESYHYPDSFDIIALRDKAAVKIRDGKVKDILALNEYRYADVPLVNSRGFSIQAHSDEEYNKFIDEFNENEQRTDATLFEKWIDFSVYRKIVFHDTFWVI